MHYPKGFWILDYLYHSTVLESVEVEIEIGRLALDAIVTESILKCITKTIHYLQSISSHLFCFAISCSRVKLPQVSTDMFKTSQQPLTETKFSSSEVLFRDLGTAFPFCKFHFHAHIV